jgi:hypothetical protein
MDIKKYFVFAFAFFLLNLSQSNVFAQEKIGFSVSPPSFEITAIPGDVISNSIRVENLYKDSLILRARPQSFVTYGEGGQVALNDEESSFSIINWLEIEKNEQIISPGSFGVYNFKLNIPKNAEPGSHYGAIVFSTVKDPTIIGSGAYVMQEIGSLILIKIPGNAYESAELISFKPEEQLFKQDHIKLLAHISNTGNIHIKPYGYIAIYNLLGQKVKTVEVSGRNILPGSKRLFDSEFKFNGFGIYTAELTLLYSGGGKIIHGKTTFLVLNLVRNAPLIIVFVAFLLFALLFRKRLRKAIAILLKG